MFMLGSTPVNGEPIMMNGAVYIFCGILKFLVASAAEAELGALFLNAKEGKILCIARCGLSHQQPPTPRYCDNITATALQITQSISNDQDQWK